MGRQSSPILVSCDKVHLAAGGAESGSRKDACDSVHRRITAGCMLIQKREAQMEIQVE